MELNYIFEGITKKEIVIALITGGASGIGWAFGSIIAIIFLELTLRNFLKNQFEKLTEAIKRIKK
ncbi:hypothetical protein HY448_01630 [Candidatus Pacearchaeota archaeon]|nr:hypothetical protein [Candidatus Pacearchaeota archaeon]